MTLRLFTSNVEIPFSFTQDLTEDLRCECWLELDKPAYEPTGCAIQKGSQVR